MTDSTVRDFYEKHGHVGIPLENDNTVFIDKINDCAHAWFRDNLDSMLGSAGAELLQSTIKNRTKNSSVKTQLADGNYKTGKVIWDAMTTDAREDVLKQLDLRTPRGHALVFDNKSKKQLFCNTGYYNYLLKSIRYAINGCQALTMGNSVCSAWAASGFGIWAHLHVAKGLEHVFVVQRRIYELFGIKLYVTGLPHLLYKPISERGALALHHDGHRTERMFKDLSALITTSPKKPNMAWLKARGIQTLSHFSGATLSSNGKPMGSTLVLSPMNPWRALVILCALHPNYPHPDIVGPRRDDNRVPTGTAKKREEVRVQAFLNRFPQYVPTPTTWWLQNFWSNDSTGPVFGPFGSKNNLSVFNRLFLLFAPGSSHTATTTTDYEWLLQMKKSCSSPYESIVSCTSPQQSEPTAVVPIVNFQNPTKSNYVACWSLQFVHGAANANNKSRISMITVLSPIPAKCTYFLDRLHHLAEVANGGDATGKQLSNQWLASHNTPLAGGATHTRPFTEVELTQEGGHFRSAAATREQARKFIDRVKREMDTSEIYCCIADNRKRSLEQAVNSREKKHSSASMSLL